MTLPSVLVFQMTVQSVHHHLLYAFPGLRCHSGPCRTDVHWTSCTFHMILMRAASCLFVKMPLHKHLIYVLIRVPLTGLVNSICLRSASAGSKPRSTGPCEPFSKCHRSNTIILRYYYIPFMTYAD